MGKNLSTQADEIKQRIRTLGGGAGDDLDYENPMATQSRALVNKNNELILDVSAMTRAEDIAGAILPEINADSFGAVGNGVIDDSAAFATALSAARSLGGVLTASPKTYKLNSGITLYPDEHATDFRRATLDFSGLSSGAAITVTSSGGSKETYIRNFRLLGPGIGSSVDALVYASETNPVAQFQTSNFLISQFRTGIKLGTNAFILGFDYGKISACAVGYSLPVAGNMGENIGFFKTVFSDCTLAIYTRNNNGDSFFNQCSTDFCAKIFDIAGNSNVRYLGGHIECTSQNEASIVVGEDTKLTIAHSRIWGGATNSPTWAKIGTNDGVVFIESCDFLGLATTSGVWFDGTGEAFANGSQFNSVPYVAQVLMSGMTRMTDGGFETGITDLAFIHNDNGAENTTDRYASANLAITRSTAQAHSGAYSLKVAKIGAPVGGETTAGVFIPIIPNTRIGGNYWVKPVVTGTYYVLVAYMAIDPVSGSEVPKITKIGGYTHAPANNVWTQLPLAQNFGYSPRIPTWATHVAIYLNMRSCNDGDAIYIDDILTGDF